MTAMDSTSKSYHGSIIYCPNCKKETTFTEHIKNGYFNKNVCDSCGWEDVSGNDIQLWNYCVYKERCKCGNELMITTQEDNNPEYYTRVGVPCPKCGELVIFSLPVN